MHLVRALSILHNTDFQENIFSFLKSARAPNGPSLKSALILQRHHRPVRIHRNMRPVVLHHGPRPVYHPLVAFDFRDDFLLDFQ